MSDRETLAGLKLAMQRAQTLGELYALMEVYSYEDFMQIYHHHLTPEQQAKLNEIEERDSRIQIVAIKTAKARSVENAY